MQVFEDKLLTIAIPTYNRPEKLKDQVSLLLKQVTDQVVVHIIFISYFRKKKDRGFIS